MPEIQNPHFSKGHKFDKDLLRRDIYRLVSYFMSSTTIAHYIDSAHLLFESGGSQFVKLQNEYLLDETCRILVQTAIVTRVIHDESPADPEEVVQPICGTLEEPIGSKRKLKHRMACNKIIHAEKINFDYVERPDAAALNPIIYLYGYQKETRWKASLDLLAFADYSCGQISSRTFSDHLEWNNSS